MIYVKSKLEWKTLDLDVIGVYTWTIRCTGHFIKIRDYTCGKEIVSVQPDRCYVFLQSL